MILSFDVGQHNCKIRSQLLVFHKCYILYKCVFHADHSVTGAGADHALVCEKITVTWNAELANQETTQSVPCPTLSPFLRVGSGNETSSEVEIHVCVESHTFVYWRGLTTPLVGYMVCGS